ncbi:MAG: shikimate kinase [Bacteroidales bacterium]|nr:shikimate kinase [Bacteroidales bacterium]
MKYYLVGYMYSGKSTFGPRLAEARGMDFLDLDQAFEERYHYTVPRFFEVFGEEAFRMLETQMLHSTAELENVVVSTGGGTPCHSGNMDFILQHGTAVYLQMTVDALVERALRSRHVRPKLHGLPEPEMRAAIGAQLKEREGVYLRAPIVLDGTAPDVEAVP